MPNSDGTPAAAASDWQQGYGFQFWMSRHGFRGDGAYGQFCVVLPEHDVVIAMTAATEQLQDLLNLMWQHLLPAFGPEPLPDHDKADTALRERLDALALPPLASAPGLRADRDTWSGTAFTPAGGECAEQRTLTTVRLTADPAAPGWTLGLDERGSSLALAFDDAGWTVTDAPVPTAVTAAWTDPATFTADVAFLETPHRLHLTCSLTSRTFTAHWRTRPLTRGSLRAYRAPQS
ncbi:hypothetical protein GA0115240_10387 [Streptomyces sp. DvalAA-14]|nr:hypothetical protein GA0115240_10387 [Streptomyces sp. DvalAA-14]